MSPKGIEKKLLESQTPTSETSLWLLTKSGHLASQSGTLLYSATLLWHFMALHSLSLSLSLSFSLSNWTQEDPQLPSGCEKEKERERERERERESKKQNKSES